MSVKAESLCAGGEDEATLRFDSRSVAFHEAGHAVVAFAHGMPGVIAMWPRANPGPRDLVVGGSFGFLENRQRCPKDVAVVCWAGAMAEVLLTDPDSYLEEFGDYVEGGTVELSPTDWAGIRQISKRAQAGARKRAWNYVVALWPKIQSVAEKCHRDFLLYRAMVSENNPKREYLIPIGPKSFRQRMRVLVEEFTTEVDLRRREVARASIDKYWSDGHAGDLAAALQESGVMPG